MTNLDSILKSRDITLSTKVHLVKAMVFPVVMYGYESWTIKKAKHQRIDAFELWLDLLAVQGTLKSLLQHQVLYHHSVSQGLKNKGTCLSGPLMPDVLLVFNKYLLNKCKSFHQP